MRRGETQDCCQRWLSGRRLARLRRLKLEARRPKKERQMDCGYLRERLEIIVFFRVFEISGKLPDVWFCLEAPGNDFLHDLWLVEDVAVLLHDFGEVFQREIYFVLRLHFLCAKVLVGAYVRVGGPSDWGCAKLRKKYIFFYKDLLKKLHLLIIRNNIFIFPFAMANCVRTLPRNTKASFDKSFERRDKKRKREYYFA